MTSPLQRARDELRNLQSNYGERDVVMGYAMHISDLRLHLELAEAVDQYIAASRNAVVNPRDFVARHQLMDAYGALCIAGRKLTKEADDAG